MYSSLVQQINIIKDLPTEEKRNLKKWVKSDYDLIENFLVKNEAELIPAIKDALKDRMELLTSAYLKLSDVNE